MSPDFDELQESASALKEGCRHEGHVAGQEFSTCQLRTVVRVLLLSLRVVRDLVSCLNAWSSVSLTSIWQAAWRAPKLRDWAQHKAY